MICKKKGVTEVGIPELLRLFIISKQFFKYFQSVYFTYLWIHQNLFLNKAVTKKH
jgi:hypothetical protein